MNSDESAVPRIILNDDGSNFLYSWDELTAEDLRTYLRRLEGTQVDLVCWCVAFGGYVTYYQSEIAEPVGTGFAFTDRVKQSRWARNRERLHHEVGDYVGFCIDTLAEMGIPALASFRMNDAHMSSDPTGPVAGRFWMNHPEWRLGEPFGYYGSCLDYSVPAVREYLRRLVLEVLETFPQIAGVELDAMRSPFFFPEGQGRERAPIMTDLVRRIRADLDEAAQRRGSGRYLLRVNVPRDPELALETGLDVAGWVEDDLVDGISPGCYGTDFQVPVEQWKALLGRDAVVHPYCNCGRGTGQYHSLEEFRGAAANGYGAGADGVYLFNFPCLDELSGLIPRPLDAAAWPPPEFHAQGYHPDLTRSRRALREIGDPEAVRHQDKRFLFYTDPPKYRHFAPEVATIQRLTGHPAELAFRCYEDLEAAEQVRVELKLVGVTIRDQFRLALNGAEISPERVQRLHAPNGRDLRIHYLPLEPFSQLSFEPRASEMQRGENTLTVSLTEADPALHGEIEVREMAVEVRY
ncbi:MAG: hypothetical protein U9R79_06685 [Armatimonadota bacterium]|nr:hypothetical protein [Armatimonadota bacterium]